MIPIGRRFVLAGLTVLPACGFEPLHAPGAPAAAMAGRVAVDPIEGAAGFALRERLTERLGPAGPAAHRLGVDLSIRREDVAITQDNITTRFLVIGTAAIRLFPPGGAEPVLADTLISQTGFSAPAGDTASAFAARAAELDAAERLARDLADRIVMRLALAADEWAGA